MTTDEMDDALVALCSLAAKGGQPALDEALRQLDEEQLERLLGHAVSELSATEENDALLWYSAAFWSSVDRHSDARLDDREVEMRIQTAILHAQAEQFFLGVEILVSEFADAVEPSDAERLEVAVGIAQRTGFRRWTERFSLLEGLSFMVQLRPILAAEGVSNIETLEGVSAVLFNTALPRLTQAGVSGDQANLLPDTGSALAVAKTCTRWIAALRAHAFDVMELSSEGWVLKDPT
ncbi:hypothetical protein [Marmoricola sp. OAE513]|uniref:hypothetical protein n=1 Tax=Marmoricola sp. OAE513 TaxID=2817894 RepID=UPI001AE30105